MTNLYHLRSGKAGSYRITKLDEDYQIESSYTVSKHECDCTAGARPTCRHRQMLPFFLAKGHIDNGWMLDWHTRQWRKPLCEDGDHQRHASKRLRRRRDRLKIRRLPRGLERRLQSYGFLAVCGATVQML